MNALGIFICIILGVLGLSILYFVIRYAVRDGIIDAQKELSGEKAPEAAETEEKQI